MSRAFNEGSWQRTRVMARALPSSIVALLALSPSSAAADEGEWVVSAEPQLGFFTGSARDASTELGAGGQASLWLGLSPAAWIFASAGGEASLGEGPSILEAIGGAVVALDVLRVIPFLELGAGADIVGGEVAPLLRLGVGADYLFSPSFSMGVVGRYRPLFGREGEDWVTVSLRLSFRGEL